MILLCDNLVGNTTDTKSKAVIKSLDSKGYRVDCSTYGYKNDMHVLRVNGKRFKSYDEYELNSNNEIEFEFSEDIKPAANINQVNLYDDDYKDIKT